MKKYVYKYPNQKRNKRRVNKRKKMKKRMEGWGNYRFIIEKGVG
jgi:hypothetical protein